MKYSFTVTANGWYKFTAAARNGRFSTRVDDINKGLSPFASAAWSSVTLTPPVYLTAGPTHVLTIEMPGFGTGLDAIVVQPTPVNYPAPRGRARAR